MEELLKKGSNVVVMTAEDLGKIIDKFADMKYQHGREDAEAEMKPMSKEEVAAYFGVSERTITNWMSEGELPFHRMGNSSRVYFTKRDINHKLSKSN